MNSTQFRNILDRLAVLEDRLSVLAGATELMGQAGQTVAGEMLKGCEEINAFEVRLSEVEAELKRRRGGRPKKNAAP